MIIDRIENRDRYYFLGEDYRLALDFLAEASYPIETSDIDLNPRVSMKLRPMMTKPISDGVCEIHRHTVDIHYTVRGEEKFGYGDRKFFTETSYNEEGDAEYLSGELEFITLRPGYFIICMPNDAHMSDIAVTKPAEIGKIIAKISL